MKTLIVFAVLLMVGCATDPSYTPRSSAQQCRDSGGVVVVKRAGSASRIRKTEPAPIISAWCHRR